MFNVFGTLIFTVLFALITFAFGSYYKDSVDAKKYIASAIYLIVTLGFLALTLVALRGLLNAAARLFT